MIQIKSNSPIKSLYICRGVLNTMAELDISKLKGGKILDVASGTGNWGIWLFDTMKNSEILIGIDIEENIIKFANEQCKKANKENIEFLNMDGESLDFPNNHKNCELILNEMKRVLKKDAYFIIREMRCDNLNEKQLSHLYYHHWAAEIDRILGKTHNETFTQEKILSIIDKLNLIEMEVIEHNDNTPIPLEVIKKMAEGIDMNINRIKNYPDYEKLKVEGEKIKKRLYEIGFEGATSVIIIEKKGV